MNSPGIPNYEVIYNVGLLDDVHNYFPALLYDHGRFQNLQSLFNYVRNQMNTRFNLFAYGASRYTAPAAASAAPAPAPAPAPAARAPPIPRLPIQRDSDLGILLRFLDISDVDIFTNTLPRIHSDVLVSPLVADLSRNTEIIDGSQVSIASCAICQDVIHSDDMCRRLIPCQHSYHRVCIDTWFARNVHCPTCRHDIRIPPVAAPAPVEPLPSSPQPSP